MQNCTTKKQPITRSIARIACVAALGMAFTIAPTQAAHADDIQTPPVPPDIQVPVQTRLVFVGHGVGTQN